MTSVVFLPQIFQSHRSPGLHQILCTRIVTHIHKLSLSLCRTSKRMGTFPFFPRDSSIINAEPLLMPNCQQEISGVLFWKLIATQLRFTRRGFLLFPSDIFASPLTSLSTPGHPSRTGAPRIAFLLPSWRYACMHPVAPSSPLRRAIRLQNTVCFPSVA